jgi:hypothetical protein
VEDWSFPVSLSAKGSRKKLVTVEGATQLSLPNVPAIFILINRLLRAKRRNAARFLVVRKVFDAQQQRWRIVHAGKVV